MGLVGSISNGAELVDPPESATVCGLPLPESENESVALRVPVVVGLKTTVAEQLADAPKLEPHDLLVIAKSPGFAPPMATLLMLIEEVVLLLNVAVCAPLVEPTFTEPNDMDVGLTETDPLEPPEPSPVSATICGEFVAESLKSNVAVRVPFAVGAKTMFAVQLAPAARLDAHVFE